MPRNGGSGGSRGGSGGFSGGSGGSRGPSGGGGWGNGRSMSTAPAPKPKAPPSSNLPAKQPPAKNAPAKQPPANNAPAKQAPPSGGGKGPSTMGIFGSSMAGSLAGTMLGAALFGPGGPGGPGGSAQEPYLAGECAQEFVKLVKCIETGCCDMDLCYAEVDELSNCHERRKLNKDL